MDDSSAGTSTPISIVEIARQFISEVAGQSERKKKPICSTPGLDAFLLYIRAQGRVPDHKVPGPITVETIVGDVSFAFDGQIHRMPAGTMICLPGGVPHDLHAQTESVVLVIRAALPK